MTEVGLKDRPLTLREASERIGVSASTLRRAIHAGRLPAYRLGERAHFRVLPADVERLRHAVRAA